MSPSEAMIHDVDATLAALLAAEAVAGGDTEVLFDAPTREWAARRGGPCIDAFLYDIREDVARREIAFEQVRDGAGRIVARRPPPRRLRLSYLLTAWTSRPEDEHRLLSALLAALLRHDAVPAEYLRGALVDQPIPVLLQLALPTGADRGIADVWNALGGELKPSLDLVVVAPFDPARVEPVRKLVAADPEVHLRASATDPRAPAAPPPPGSRPAGAGPRTRRVQEL
ncbi:DUF4255 domain-containing protein [Parafrankia sp. EUN1f]|uniref:DUF4255 domain-containing protein n=1 Tax=Parafrankia sp. EUN1f TaxID=102897 RepID=UPI0001C44A23|nr:DUF4255 domain-containing protein [Parafrankia sp. EUN1f]EFC85046.1 hypothetical protein FrEUN1fDRAFT_1832 [Parafrankia sp. EUN1f]